jgi:hypothetical protein
MEPHVAPGRRPAAWATAEILPPWGRPEEALELPGSARLGSARLGSDERGVVAMSFGRVAGLLW